MSKTCFKFKPRIVRHFIFFTLFVRQIVKNGHGALVGLTIVKGTSVENFVFLKILRANCFWYL